MKKRTFLFSFLAALLTGGSLVICPNAAVAQVPFKIYQLSGMVMDQMDTVPVPFARISINQTRRGGFSNETGFFSIPVMPGDTLYFKRMGYESDYLIVDEVLRGSPNPDGIYQYTLHLMMPNDLGVPDIKIYSYKNAYEVKMAIANMAVPGATPVELSAENLRETTSDFYVRALPFSEEDNLSIQDRDFLMNYATRGFRPYAPVVDPVAIVRLIQYIGDRSDEKKQKIYRSWLD